MPAPPFFAIDVGNSRIKAGLFGPAPPGRLPACMGATAFPVRDPDPAVALDRWLAARDEKPATALLGGVNPKVIAAIRNAWQDEWPELAPLDRPPRDLLVNRTDAPERVGPDRLFDSVAANRIRRVDTPAIVVGAGTSTTVNYIDRAGAFRGGAILPGFEMIAAALHERTALLPRIDATNLTAPDPLGRDTEAALRSGLYWGLVGGVKELVTRFLQTATRESGQPPLLLLTGGASPLLAPHLPAARVEPHLTLQGLVLSAEFGMRDTD